MHLFRVAAGQIAPAAAADKKRVAGDQAVPQQKTLGARSVPWRVKNGHGDRTDGDFIPSFDPLQTGWRNRNQAELFLVDHHLRIGRLQQIPHSIDMIEMGVGDDGGGDAHFILAGYLQNTRDVPCGVHHGCFTRFQRADQVNKVLQRPKLNLLELEIHQHLVILGQPKADEGSRS